MESGAHREQPAGPAPQSVQLPSQNLGRHPMPTGAPRFLGNGCLPFPQVEAVGGGALEEAQGEMADCNWDHHGGHSGYL